MDSQFLAPLIPIVAIIAVAPVDPGEEAKNPTWVRAFCRDLFAESGGRAGAG